MNAIYVMWSREVRKFLRSRSRIIGALGQPLLYLVSLGYGLGAVFQAAGQGNYIEFLAPGIIGMSIIFTSIFNGMQVIWDRQFGFLKETMVAPVSRFSIMLGRTLGGATVAMLQGTLILVLTFFVGFHPYSWALVPVALLVMFLVATLFSSLGMAVASLLRDMQGFQLIMNFLVMPLFFLSGALFPLGSAPKALQIVSYVDPLSYGIDAMRGLLINMSHFGMTLDIVMLAIFTGGFLAFGSYAFSRIQA